MAVARDDVHSVTYRCHIQVHIHLQIRIQTDTYTDKTDYFNLRSLDYRYRYRTIHTPDTELDGEI